MRSNRAHVPPAPCLPRRAIGNRRACPALVASFAAGVAVSARHVLERIAPFHTGVLIATFYHAAPARCGAFADERRIVAGDGGGRETNAHPVCGFRSGWWVLGVGVRDPAGGVVAISAVIIAPGEEVSRPRFHGTFATHRGSRSIASRGRSSNG